MHFGPLGWLTKLEAKLSELVQKFVRRGRVGVFNDERTQSTHWTLISCFGAFHTIWVHLGPLGCLMKLGAKRSELVQNSCDEVTSEFFTMNAPDPPHWTLNSCFVAFVPFGCIWDR